VVVVLVVVFLAILNRTYQASRAGRDATVTPENPPAVPTVTNAGDTAVAKKLLETCYRFKEYKDHGGIGTFTLKEEVTVPEGFIKELPPKPESRRVAAARQHWEAMKTAQESAHRSFMDELVKCGNRRAFTPSYFAEVEATAKIATKDAWVKYQEVLREEK